MTRQELLKTAKPMLFNTEMVRAILDGKKTQTRRVIKPQPHTSEFISYSVVIDGNEAVFNGTGTTRHIDSVPLKIKPSDILWVRETYLQFKNIFYYKADSKHCELEQLGIKFKWKPSIHLPKKAARIFLRVTDVRAERLQDITDEQAKKEGAIIIGTNMSKLMHIVEFISLWNSTIKKKELDKYGWKANPWVWVYEFERIKVE